MLVAMASRRIEEHLEALNRLRTGTAEVAVPAVRRALTDRSNVVAAKAAKVAVEMSARDMIPDLLSAFERLFEDAVKRDPQCWAKNEIARALRDFDYGEAAPFLRGAKWVQKEPVWGGEADTAGTLRGICLLALPGCAGMRRETILRLLVDALVEDDPAVRADAARAISAMGGEDAALVLRLKARTGDKEPAVTGQVFESLLAVERSEGLEFVGGFLRPEGGEAAEEAALAIGGSRMEKGVDVLAQAWEHARGEEYRTAILRALGISRQQAAIGFLKRVEAEGRSRDQEGARAALQLAGVRPGPIAGGSN
jgi:HEAT repeat protein